MEKQVLKSCIRKYVNPLGLIYLVAAVKEDKLVSGTDIGTSDSSPVKSRAGGISLHQGLPFPSNEGPSF